MTCISQQMPSYCDGTQRPDHSIAANIAGGTHLASVRRTLFGWNNETLNAWTMIIGLIITSSLWLLAR